MGRAAGELASTAATMLKFAVGRWSRTQLRGGRGGRQGEREPLLASRSLGDKANTGGPVTTVRRTKLSFL